uniref:Uncharacterized protein n=1 Tax=Anguilla anguilla TaxID=7936 RepID=A0A0E9UPH5_ANGAN
MWSADYPKLAADMQTCNNGKIGIIALTLKKKTVY